MSSSTDSGRIPSPGQRLGDYEIESVLGRGGMGTVFVARHSLLQARRALKVQRLQTAVHQERFAREARTLAKVDRHPGVVRIHEHGWLNERRTSAWVVMDLIDGPTLAEELVARGPMPLARVSLIGARLADALAHVHAAGVVHRDLKPDNVLLRREDDQPILTDFGLARDEAEERLTATGQLLGTLQYMSPEQASGSKAVGPEGDVFALGLVLYELLTGETAFEAEAPYELLRMIISGDPPDVLELRPELPLGVAALLKRMLEKTPGDRPTAAEAAAALHRVAAGEELEVERDGGPPTWLVVAGGALALGLVVGGAVLLSARPAPPAAAVAPASPTRAAKPATDPDVGQRAERRSRIATARARISESPPASVVIRVLDACARPAGAGASPQVDQEATQLAQDAIRYVLERPDVRGEDIVGIARALARLGIRLGRDPLTRQLMPFFGTRFHKLSDAQLGRLYTDYLRLDLPIDMAGALPARVTSRLPEEVEATFLLLRNRAFVFDKPVHRARRELLRFMEARGDRLGPITRSNGLWMAAGLADVPPERQLRLVREAVRLDPQSPYAQAALGVALARTGDVDAALRTLENLDRHPFARGSIAIRCLRCWGFAFAGERDRVEQEQRELLSSFSAPWVRELCRETLRTVIAHEAKRAR